MKKLIIIILIFLASALSAQAYDDNKLLTETRPLVFTFAVPVIYSGDANLIIIAEGDFAGSDCEYLKVEVEKELTTYLYESVLIAPTTKEEVATAEFLHLWKDHGDAELNAEIVKVNPDGYQGKIKVSYRIPAANVANLLLDSQVVITITPSTWVNRRNAKANVNCEFLLTPAGDPWPKYDAPTTIDGEPCE